MSDKLTYANIIRQAILAVSTDQATIDWCMATYGLRPSVRNDLDPMNPPNEGDCPLVAFSPVGGENGQDRAEFVRGFVARVAVYDEEEEVESDPITGRILTQIYKGTERVSHLLENLVYPALTRRFNSLNCPLSTEDETIENMQGFLFQARAGITIQFMKTIGEDRPFL